MKFAQIEEFARDGEWKSFARTMIWLSFDTLKEVRRVTPVTDGVRYCAALRTPITRSVDSVGLGSPTYLHDPESFDLRRLTPMTSQEAAVHPSDGSSEVVQQASVETDL